MNMDVPPLGAVERTPSTAGPAAPGGRPFDGAMTASPDIPGSPPADVMRDVEAAARRAEWLREQGQELHFEVDPESRRIRVEVRTLDGELVRVVPPSEGPAVATGGAL